MGVEQAGFRTVAAVEWDDDAADSMEKNRNEYFPELREVVRGNLYPLASGAGDGISTRDILKAGGLSSRNRPELLVGGPPCVAFSKSGFWLDWKRDGIDPAASLLQAHPDGFTMSQFREALGNTRKHALPLANELDARGITRRRDDVRIGGPRLPAL